MTTWPRWAKVLTVAFLAWLLVAIVAAVFMAFFVDAGPEGTIRLLALS